jgi:hypothetical protein
LASSFLVLNLASPAEVRILYHLECPYLTYPVEPKDVFNWTATYRRDSDIPAPYSRWVYYEERVKQNNKLHFNNSCNLARRRCATPWWWHRNVETCWSMDYVNRHYREMCICDINCAIFGYHKNNWTFVFIDFWTQ